jgi:succinate dehydrogenase / fumarate reductase iron-sulfur subunit
MDLTLHVWRQPGPGEAGKMVTYTEEAKGISPDMSFLEMLDIVNERLIAANREPIAFEHDCREGICGSCGMMINGQAHGPERGTAPDANLIPVPKPAADAAMDAAACIACGACVAACPNSAAQLFTAAKMQHLNLLPQGQPERWRRTAAMVDTMEEFFGSCTLHGECQEACPKEISIDFIAYLNRDYIKAQVKNRKLAGQT